MTVEIIVYVALSLVLGGVAATITIWMNSDEIPRAAGQGTFTSPKLTAIGIGLFVAVLWPLLLISAVL